MLVQDTFGSHGYPLTWSDVDDFLCWIPLELTGILELRRMCKMFVQDTFGSHGYPLTSSGQDEFCTGYLWKSPVSSNFVGCARFLYRLPLEAMGIL